MTDVFANPRILNRFDELIAEGEKQLWELQKHPSEIHDPARLSQWTTSSFNLLDKLSVSSNRFVQELERYGRVSAGSFNIGLALGVLRAARDEYTRGLAVDYHLSVASAVFGDLLAQAEYLENKGYLRAAAILAGAALEEGLRARARAASLELSGRETLIPLIHKLKAPDVGVLGELEATRLEGWARVRNKAAHGEEFDYGSEEVAQMRTEVGRTLERVIGRR